ncbi:unnamed protein product, partial [Porites evermanni]
AREVEQRFEEKWGFPGVLGAIDRCHILVKGPRKNLKQYINHKGFHSPQLQNDCKKIPQSLIRVDLGRQRH